MKSKLFIFSTVFTLFLSDVAIAYDPPPRPTPPTYQPVGEPIDCPRPFAFFHGFYIGQGVGLAINTANTDLNLFIRRDQSAGGSNPQINGTLTHSSVMDLYQSRLYGDFFAGWGYQFRIGAHLGIRLGVNLSSFDIIHKEKSSQTSPNAGTQEVKSAQAVQMKSKVRSVDYTIDGKFGWAFANDTMIYVLAGGSINKPEAVLEADTLLEVINLPEGITQSMERVEEKDYSKGYRFNLHLGLGIEHKLTKHLGLNTLYTFTDFGTRTPSVSGSEFVTNLNGITTQYSTKFKSRIRRHSVTTGITYHF